MIINFIISDSCKTETFADAFADVFRLLLITKEICKIDSREAFYLATVG